MWMSQISKETQNSDSSVKMTWFYWLIEQFWWSLAHSKHLHFCLRVSNHWNQYPAVISELMEYLACCGSRNSYTIIPGYGNFTTIGNKHLIQLIFICSCCFKSGTTVEMVQTSLFFYLWHSRQKTSQFDSYLFWNFVSFSQCMNDSFLCFWDILKSCQS